MAEPTRGVGDAILIGSSTWTDGSGSKHVARGILLGTAGSITLTLESGDSLTTDALAVGVIHPIRFTKVTANSADGVVVCF